METRKEVALESPLYVRGVRLTPLTVTYVCSPESAAGMVVIVREAIGVIVQGAQGIHALMTDGREVGLEQLVAEYPTLDLADMGLL